MIICIEPIDLTCFLSHLYILIVTILNYYTERAEQCNIFTMRNIYYRRYFLSNLFSQSLSFLGLAIGAMFDENTRSGQCESSCRPYTNFDGIFGINLFNLEVPQNELKLKATVKTKAAANSQSGK